LISASVVPAIAMSVMRALKNGFREEEEKWKRSTAEHLGLGFSNAFDLIHPWIGDGARALFLNWENKSLTDKPVQDFYSLVRRSAVSFGRFSSVFGRFKKFNHQNPSRTELRADAVLDSLVVAGFVLGLPLESIRIYMEGMYWATAGRRKEWHFKQVMTQVRRLKREQTDLKHLKEIKKITKGDLERLAELNKILGSYTGENILDLETLNTSINQTRRKVWDEQMKYPVGEANIEQVLNNYKTEIAQVEASIE